MPIDVRFLHPRSKAHNVVLNSSSYFWRFGIRSKVIDVSQLLKSRVLISKRLQRTYYPLLWTTQVWLNWRCLVMRAGTASKHHSLQLTACHQRFWHTYGASVTSRSASWRLLCIGPVLVLRLLHLISLGTTEYHWKNPRSTYRDPSFEYVFTEFEFQFYCAWISRRERLPSDASVDLLWSSWRDDFTGSIPSATSLL